MRKTTKKKLVPKQKEIKRSKSACKETNARNEHIEPDNDVCNEDNTQAFENIAIQTKLYSKKNDARVEDNPQAFEDNAVQSEGNSEVAVENKRLIQVVYAEPPASGPGFSHIYKRRRTTKRKLAHKQNEINKSISAFKDTNSRNEHIEPGNTVCNEDNTQAFENSAIQNKLNSKNNDTRVEDNPQAFEDNAMQTEGSSEVAIENSKNNDARVEDNPQAFEDNAMQIEGNSEVAMKTKRFIQDVDADPIVEKIIRGSTKGKSLSSSYPVSRIKVEFNAVGVPIGEGSVKLSSFLGPLVREHVPVTLNNWRQLSDKLKVVLWDSIQARFKLEEKYQKVIFQQMGSLWRTSKCVLVRKIVNAKTKKERLKLKPKNIKSMKEWTKFVKSKTSSDFKTLSEKFKAMRRNQINHTCSRKGMARLAEELKKESADPSSVSRAQVWIKSRTRINGEPINMTIADTIEKIKKIENESQFKSTTDVRNDVISQVLGQDGPGRLRAMGRGVTLTKLNLSRTKDKRIAKFEGRMLELEKLVYVLSRNQGKESSREECTPQTGEISNKCDLLDWSETDEVVAEGRVVSSDPNEFVHKIPLGPNAMKILIDFPRKSDAFLWRPTSNLMYIREAEDEVVAWPSSRVVFRMIEHHEKEDNVSKTSSTCNKCKLYDWGGSEELVAEGRLYSSDPEQLVNDIPLGPSAMVVWIDNSKKQDAFLWRPSSGMTYVGEAVGSKVAWPESKVVVEKIDVVASSAAGNFMPKNKGKLIDM